MQRKERPAGLTLIPLPSNGAPLLSLHFVNFINIHIFIWWFLTWNYYNRKICVVCWNMFWKVKKKKTVPRSTNQAKLYQKIIISIKNIALLHVHFAKILRENLFDISFLTFYSSIKTWRIQLLSSQGYYLQIPLFSESAKQQKFLGDIMKK